MPEFKNCTPKALTSELIEIANDVMTTYMNMVVNNVFCGSMKTREKPIIRTDSKAIM
ncbi:hypothetical protein FACS1894161_5410 [Spirochaetia bacterium]|nr:hypothetical protein FACS1894161_5410 [Spirochaetia bacterium]